MRVFFFVAIHKNMKRQGYLVTKIAARQNLDLAYYKAQKGKADKKDVLAYSKMLHENLRNLQQQLLSGDVATGNYSYFTLYDPKERVICAAPFSQRVLHHALMNVCHEFFERVQIYHSYATRPGKGTYAAIEKAKVFSSHYNWFLKLDFKKYFDSLDHSVLKSQLRGLFKDPGVLNIFDIIIDSYAIEPGCGVPIGNLTSQYFANHYLSRLDHYIKENLKIKGYIRYMDDLVLWHNDKGVLKNALPELTKYSKANLQLSFKPFCLNRTSHGLNFLGYLLYPDKIRLSNRSRKRFIQKLRIYTKNLKSGLWTQKEYQNHMFPLIAFTEFAGAKEFRKKAIANL